jgi:hypothetical protein
MENSLGGCQYFSIFINDYTRMTSIYFLKEKFESFEKFINFQQMVENETKEKVTTLITNNEAQFTSTKFNYYFHDNGIKKKITNLLYSTVEWIY